MSATHVQDLLRQECARLASAVAELDPSQWQTPSLCAQWSVRDVLSHLTMPYELSLARMAVGMIPARFSFDRFAAAWARDDERSGPSLALALESFPDRKFRVPGAPAEAPLSHVVAHAGDILRPLGLPHVVEPNVGQIVLNQLVTTGRKSLPPGLLAGRRFVATDAPWSHGDGPEVTGSAAALILTLLGRSAAFGELRGGGVAGVSEAVARHNANGQ